MKIVCSICFVRSCSVASIATHVIPEPAVFSPLYTPLKSGEGVGDIGQTLLAPVSDRRI